MGIILFLMLSGSFPFDLRNIEQEIKESPVFFSEKKWGHISELCKSFILNLLDKSHTNRPSAAKALEHPWFQILKNDATYKADHSKV